ncbi:archaeal proteasome endopeptidase complex subunit alpha [Haloarchaeobius sp. DT45]|uniref:archaeal proteasome endopeptidase complex subunit alpha n=1 Tax=Haloarchaeobius sp. DT45 TaxID=3446116 RepID=UPI003F6CD32E
MQGSTNQQAYDRGSTIFSPDGRLYQVEYAREAVRRGSATVGVRTADSVVFASYGRRRSDLLEPESIEKLHDVDGRLGLASAGHVADARRLVDFARRFAQQERLRYGQAPGVETTAKAIADHVQESTQTGGTRPFGTALLVGGVPADAGTENETARPRLFETDPSGTPYEWRATAIGGGSGRAQELLEDEWVAGLSTEDGVSLALDALAASTEDDLAPESVGLAVMDAAGYRSVDPGGYLT